MPEALLFTAREAAASLKISEKLLWTHTKNGTIPVVRLGRRVLYDPRDLVAWIDRQKTCSTPVPVAV